MSVMQVGSKLVRTFGSGSNLRHAITETVGNKTFTEVLDSEGKLLANRVKEITRQNIGDKLVITRKTDDMQKDLVYDKNGKFLGMRILDWFVKGKPACVLKTNSRYVGRWKYYNVHSYTRTVSDSLFGVLKKRRVIGRINGTPSECERLFYAEPVWTLHTGHGIPIPHKLCKKTNQNFYPLIDAYEYPSLKEMVGEMTDAFAKGSGYEHLNYVKPKFDILEYAKNLKNEG